MELSVTYWRCPVCRRANLRTLRDVETFAAIGDPVLMESQSETLDVMGKCPCGFPFKRDDLTHKRTATTPRRM